LATVTNQAAGSKGKYSMPGRVVARSIGTVGLKVPVSSHTVNSNVVHNRATCHITKLVRRGGLYEQSLVSRTIMATFLFPFQPSHLAVNRSRNTEV